MRRLSPSFAMGLVTCAMLGATSAFAAPLDTPLISTIDATRASITFEVQAGPSGAPAGFLVQWMTQADYDRLGGWPLDPYYSGLYYCEMDDYNGRGPTLHTELSTSSFLLGPNGTARFEMGDIFDETGLYADYVSEMNEGTGYVFRVYAIGDGYSDDSPLSATLHASTDPRGNVDCTLTQGWWKTHSNSWAQVLSLQIGSVTYTHAQLISIFNTPAGGNGLIFLAHQLIAAKLNVLFGATPPPSVATAISQADALIGGLVIPPVGAGYLSPASTSALTATLDAFNNGTTGPGHCPDSGGITPAQQSTWGRIKAIYR
jgi:hypothetical protein